MSVQLIKKIIYYNLSEKRQITAAAIQNVIQSYDLNIKYSFESSPFVLKENIQKDTLLVSSDENLSQLYSIMFEKGVSFFMKWENFRSSYQDILQLRTINSAFPVILAFLPVQLNNFLDNIFKLYGYNVIVIDNFSDLQKNICEKPGYIILNQDFNLLPKKPGRPPLKKEKIFRYLQSKKAENSDLIISVIKDFNQGSLFDDISSSVKNICSLLLSPEEYILFIKRFLYEYSVKKITDFYETDNLISSSVFAETGKVKNEKMFLNLLKDHKKIYKEIIDKLEDSKIKTKIAFFEQYCEELKTLQTKNSLLKWIAEFFNESEERKNRASFSFIDKSADTFDKLIQLTSKNETKSAANNSTIPVSKSVDFPDLSGMR
ncbi:MAG: hypothetical protein OEZ13_07695 [Spirochaetia bacterium]|nr:hypothetical protein [Spirochaetia bacterium]